MTTKKYELIDHTADLGLMIYGNHFFELLQNAAYALTDQMVETASIDKDQTREIIIEGQSNDEIFIRFLRELLFLFETQLFLCSELTVNNLDSQKIHFKLKGDFFDIHKYSLKTQIKAITYHDFKIEKKTDGLVATLILDI
ncbi:MAG: archease [Deltaproteobacteria bacterium]|nr:archease [Deltaproteobacteria bacterium]